MKPRIIALGHSLIILVLLSSCLAGAAISQPPSPAISDLVGAWLGSAREYRLLRIELDGDGTGFICVSYPGNRTSYLYKITAWEIEKFNIRLTTRAIGNETPSIKFGTIQFERSGLRLLVDGEKVELLKESVLKGRSERAREEIQRQRDR